VVDKSKREDGTFSREDFSFDKEQNVYICPAGKVLTTTGKLFNDGEDIMAASERAIRVIEKLRGVRLTKAAELAEAGVEETLTYYAFPEEHWRRIRTNNPLEYLLREIRRRTRVVGAFPDGQSALNLAAARLRHVAGTAWSSKRYLNIALLKDQQITGAITA
jgi:transposase-like protein